jgi:predicted site-specific integrase-resolvase
MSESKYTTSKVARAKLGVCNKTLRSWALNGKVDFILTEGKNRRYNVDKYLKEHNLTTKKKICYARVSSHDQKKDLDEQINFLSSKYPEYEIIADIGSGINFKRKGLQKIIELAINNELEEVVVTYKDRLCRIGYDLIEFMLEKYSKTKITIVNDEFKLPQEEITEDLIEIITVYSSKLYGSRSHKNIAGNDKKE